MYVALEVTLTMRHDEHRSVFRQPNSSHVQQFENKQVWSCSCWHGKSEKWLHVPCGGCGGAADGHVVRRPYQAWPRSCCGLSHTHVVFMIRRTREQLSAVSNYCSLWWDSRSRMSASLQAHTDNLNVPLSSLLTATIQLVKTAIASEAAWIMRQGNVKVSLQTGGRTHA